MTKHLPWEFYKSVGSPRYILAPMVDGSDLPWRKLARLYGAELCYSPMLSAKQYLFHPVSRAQFSTEQMDRPLIAQFCGNDAKTILEAAKLIEHNVDAIDLNLGCPQDIAKKGHYGAYLQDEWPLIEGILRNLVDNLNIPVTCKIRIFPELEKTLLYVDMLLATGISMLAVHGRTREQRGSKSGKADWDVIKAIVSHVNGRIPIIANGNIAYYENLNSVMAYTGCQAVMVAETHLYNPVIFLGRPLPLMSVIKDYVEILVLLSYSQPSIVRGHLFKLLRHVFLMGDQDDLRQALATARTVPEMISVAGIVNCKDLDSLPYIRSCFN